VSNSAVANAVENLQAQIDAIGFNVDGVTIDRSTGILKIADNVKGCDNSVGDVHVTTGALPANLQQNTRYNVYKDITVGTTNVDGMSVIQLPAGSKIVPKGGIPQIAVTGGELSWVHSSDIGMIQDLPEYEDDPTLSVSENETRKAAWNAERRARGDVNKQVLKMLVKSRWNLILDGDYLVTSYHSAGTPQNPIDDWHEADLHEEIEVERPLEIQGGGLYSTNTLMVIKDGGSLKAKGVTFGHKNLGSGYSGAYMLFALDMRGCLLDHVIFEDCRFTGGERYIRSRSLNVRCSSSRSVVNKGWKNPQSVEEVLGLSRSQYKWKTGQDERAIYYLPADAEVTDDAATNLRNALYAGGYVKDIYVPCGDTPEDGSKAFVMVAVEAPSTTSTPNSSGTMAKADFDGETVTYGGLVKYGVDVNDQPVWCRFKEVTVGSEEDPGAPYYEPVPIDGFIKDNVYHDSVEAQGIGTFIMKGCLVEGNTGILIEDVMVRDVFRIEGCHFTGMEITGFRYAATNYLECATEWNYRSCPLYVTDNVFEGPYRVQDAEKDYRCAILYEGPEIHFKRNTVKNIAGNYKEIYDTYLTAQKVYYEDNTVRNVFKAPVPRGSEVYYMAGAYVFEWGKSKQCNGTKDWWEARGSGDTSALTERVYRRNSFVTDTDEAWLMAKPYFMEKYLDTVSGTTEDEREAMTEEELAEVTGDATPAIFEIFRKYCLRTVLCGYVARMAFKRIVWEDNVFSIPDGTLCGRSTRGIRNITEEFSFCGNRLEFAHYMGAGNIDTLGYVAGEYGYNSFILSAECAAKVVSRTANMNYDSSTHERIDDMVTDVCEPVAVVRIEGNVFGGGDGTVMNLFCQKGAAVWYTWWAPVGGSRYMLQPYLAKSISIRGNRFADCGFRCSAETAALSGTLNYNGDLRAEHIDVGGNDVRLAHIANAGKGNSAYGSGSPYPGSTAISASKTLTCESLYLYATKDVTAEIQDGQTEAAPCAKTLKAHLADGKMRLRVVTQRMIRPTTVADGAITEDLSLKIPVYILRPSTAIETTTRPTDIAAGLRLRASFTMGGVRQTRTVEAQRTNNGGGTALGWSVRDAAGIRHGGTASSWQGVVTLAGDAGLLLHVRCDGGSWHNSGMLIEFSLYTPATGTLNDPGTDIEIEVTMLGGVETVNFVTGEVTGGAVTPIEAFVPRGSVVGDDWLDATNDYDDVDGTQGSVLDSDDTGFWVLDGSTAQLAIWTGQSWVTR
jgi:hypothetical protein